LKEAELKKLLNKENSFDAIVIEKHPDPLFIYQQKPTKKRDEKDPPRLFLEPRFVNYIKDTTLGTDIYSTS
jgi:hypothetical protein